MKEFIIIAISTISLLILLKEFIIWFKCNSHYSYILFLKKLLSIALFTTLFGMLILIYSDLLFQTRLLLLNIKDYFSFTTFFIGTIGFQTKFGKEYEHKIRIHKINFTDKFPFISNIRLFNEEEKKFYIRKINLVFYYDNNENEILLYDESNNHNDKLILKDISATEIFISPIAIIEDSNEPHRKKLKKAIEHKRYYLELATHSFNIRCLPEKPMYRWWNKRRNLINTQIDTSPQ